MLSTRRYHAVLLAALAVVFVWSVMRPHDLFTWLLEALPVIIGLPILLLTYRRFPLSRLAYGLLLIHAVILLVGAHYTYAEMPLFSWLRDTYDLDRNYYDRLGHIAQGFIPAIVVREILLRQSPLQPGKWLGLIVLSICLAISALYEMLEWWVAVASGSDAVAFLATQGDVWDTQWDMFLCLLGAIASLILLSRWHDKSLQRLT